MPAYDLLIGIGNTFLKWGLFRNSTRGIARENRLESGHALLEEIPALAAQFTKFRAPAQIVISNETCRPTGQVGRLPYSLHR